VAAERLSRLLQLIQQLAIDVAFASFVCHQVPEVAHLGLADPVDATEPLLEAVGVPRQVIVDHQVSPLEVDAFAGGVRGQEYADFRVVLERLLRLHPVLAADTAVDDDHGFLAAQQSRDPGLEVVERVAVFGEHDELLVRRWFGRRKLVRACQFGE
jgi:hypothetical protein